jgi:hypothetical protein
MMWLEGRRQPLALFLNFLEVGKDAASADSWEDGLEIAEIQRGGIICFLSVGEVDHSTHSVLAVDTLPV